MPFNKRYGWWWVLFFLYGCIVHGREGELEPLTIETAAGDVIHYQIELAVSQRDKERGLMFRESLPEDRGMLFIYRPEKTVAMWMKNTLLPLDMLFIDKEGKIARIESDTVPGSLKVISSGAEVRAVLELNAGQASKHGIKAGDRVFHSVFAQR